MTICAHNQYQTILADPPYYYAHRMSGTGMRFGGGASAHYPLMQDAEILAMADFVDSLADKPCALCLWATCPRLDFAIEVIRAWGFRYVTVLFHWVKTDRVGLPIFGPGSYTASNLELLLLGRRGKLRRERQMMESLVMHPRLEHSRKPPIVRDRIVQVLGDVPRIELFARERTDGWDAWGDEIGKFDQSAQVRMGL